jgi:hypothetical protein
MIKSLRYCVPHQDLLAVPPHLVAEIIDGELTTSPRPGPRPRLSGLPTAKKRGDIGLSGR